MEQCSGQPAQSFWIFKNPRVLATTWHGVHHAIDQKWNPTKALKQQDIGTGASINTNQNTKFKFLEIKTCKAHEQQGSMVLETTAYNHHHHSNSNQTTAYNIFHMDFLDMMFGSNNSRVLNPPSWFKIDMSK